MRQVPVILIMLTSSLAAGNTPPATRVAAQRASVSQQALEWLHQYTPLQSTLTVQNATTAYGIQKARIIAELLINSDGTLNLTACPSIKSLFISTDPQSAETNMSRVLDELDESWQSFFASITAPQNVGHPGHVLLRAFFGLKPKDEVTDRYAKVAVLSAMLAPDNHEPLQRAASYYKSIVMQGSIHRLVNKRTECFFFLPVLADNDFYQPFELSSSGTFAHTHYSLFDAPGFAAARNIMGGASIADLLDTVMQSLTRNSNDTILQVTPEQVIAAMAQVIAYPGPRALVARLRTLGSYAFSSLTNHPVLCGAYSACTSMAEDLSPDSIRVKINRCIAHALETTWNDLGTTAKVTQFQTTFMRVLNHSYRLLYNLNIPLTQTSSCSGFQLYKRVLRNPTVLGTRIVTPQALRQLILDALSTTAAHLGSTKKAQAIKAKLAATVNTDDFLNNVLWAYDPANQNDPNPMKNYLSLSRTPMQSCDVDVTR